MEQTDEEVVKQVLNGDNASFGVLVDRYEAKLLRYAKKFLLFEDDATDLVQDVFIKAYTNLQSFDTERRFSPWIYRIAHNEFINELRRREKAPLPFFDPDTIFPHPVAEEKTDTLSIQHELREAVQECFSKLEAKYREPLILYFLEHMSYQDISEILRIPVSTVGVRISRGKTKLQSFCDITT